MWLTLVVTNQSPGCGGWEGALWDGVMSSEISLCQSREHRMCDSLSDYPVGPLSLVLLTAFLAALVGRCKLTPETPA